VKTITRGTKINSVCSFSVPFVENECWNHCEEGSQQATSDEPNMIVGGGHGYGIIAQNSIGEKNPVCTHLPSGKIFSCVLKSENAWLRHGTQRRFSVKCWR